MNILCHVQVENVKKYNLSNKNLIGTLKQDMTVLISHVGTLCVGPCCDLQCLWHTIKLRGYSSQFKTKIENTGNSPNCNCTDATEQYKIQYNY